MHFLLYLSVANHTYSLGDTAMLKCVGRGGNIYQWLVNGRELKEESLYILTLPNVTADTGGKYTCNVFTRGLASPQSTISTFLLVNPYFVSHPGDVQASVGNRVVLICDAEAFPSPGYLWHRVDGMEIRNDVVSNGRNLVIPSVQLGDLGDYYCTVSSSTLTVQSESGRITGNYFQGKIQEF